MVDGLQIFNVLQEKETDKSSKFENHVTISISNSCLTCNLVDELLLVRWKESIIRVRSSSCYERESAMIALLL